MKTFRRQKSTTMFCFSPPVMIATFIVEVAMVFWLLFRRKLNRTMQISVVLLLCLAIFQLAEFAVCEEHWFSSDAWAKIGFSAITVLPPLGLHLVYTIARKKNHAFIWSGYALAALWIGIFVFGGVMQGHVCDGNYVIFEIKDPAEGIYYTYYNTFIAIAMVQAMRFWRSSRSKRITRALQALFIGYLSFTVPSFVLRMLFEFDHEASNSALPSIMCGFAVLLALILTFRVVPLDSKPKK